MHAVVCLVIPLFGEQAVNVRCNACASCLCMSSCMLRRRWPQAAKVGYHGFGLTYPPQQLAGDAAAFRGTVQRLLSDSSFQVRQSSCLMHATQA